MEWYGGRRAQALIVVGMGALAFAVAMMRIQNDVLADLGFGIGMPLQVLNATHCLSMAP